TVVALKLENLLDAKRVVNFTARLDPSADKSAWTFQMTPGIQIPAHESRVVNLIVNATSNAKHRDSAYLVVQGRSLGRVDEIASVRIHLVASVPPGPQTPILYFHSAKDTSRG